MLTQHIVAEAATAAGIEAPARFVPVTGSTNTDLVDLAGRGAPAWTVVAAGHQEAGRGRLGRGWVSSPGSSLLVSVLLRPALPPSEAPLLSMAAAVAAVEACRRAAGVDARCKWPNDVVVGKRKLAGILPEAGVVGGRLAHVVIGLGLNVTQTAGDFPPDLRPTATSIALEGGRADPAGLLREFLAALRALRVDDGGLGDRVLPPYRSACTTLGRRVRATLAGGREVEGLAADVGPTGELALETEGGPVRIGFGEIVHVDP